jgi:hypothetical protein
VYYEHFIVGDYLFDPKVYNEFSPGNKGVSASYAARGAVEFPLFGLPWMLEGDYRSFRYPYTGGAPVTVIGGYGQTLPAPFTAKDTDLDGRFGLKVADPRIYIGLGYLNMQDNYGYPKQNGVGFGVEKLPDLDQTFSVYGSVYYYPSVNGNFTYPSDAFTTAGGLAGTTAKLSDRFLKYQIGVSILLTGSQSEFGVFLDGGYLGDSVRGKNLSPSDATHNGAYLGLGLKF